ncbi:MAG TPA: CBS domain-containing protein, partial [Candidatus Thermoplasmatota archaeon]|nr:CBS domain-containing protein [Candidatus Thermoplasmatota archaeon]
HAVVVPAAVNVLDLVQVNEIMTKAVETVQADAPVRQVVEKRFSTGHQGYPVVDAEGRLVGIITSTDMRTKVKEGDLDRPVRDFMTRDPAHVFPGATAHDALMEMVARNIGHLPVVHDEDPRRIVGFLTRQDVLGVERRIMAEEERHDPYFHWPRRR